MENRIRVGVLVFQDDKLLLVHLGKASEKYSWWVVPGGQLQGEETIFQCGEREVLEETTLRVKATKIAYLRQLIFREAQTNSLEVFLVAENVRGSLSMHNLGGRGGDEEFIREIGFFRQEDVGDMNVFPDMIKDQMWRDRELGFPSIKFIGIDQD